MKTRIGAGILAAIAIAAGVFLFVRRAPKIPPTAPPAPVSAPADAILTAQARPRTVLAVFAPVEGVLDALFLDVGAEVIEGQLLGRVRIQNADSAAQQAQDEVDRARARLTVLSGEQLSAKLESSRVEAEKSRAQGELDRLKKNYERQKGLWEMGATARLAFEKAEKDYKDALAASEKLDITVKNASERSDSIAREIESLNRSIEERTAAAQRAKESAQTGEVHSPVEGIVVSRSGQPGERVDTSTKLMEIAAKLTELQAVSAPDAATLAQIHAGQAAVVRLGDQEIPGVVQEVNAGNVVVYFNAPEPVKKLDDPVQVRIKF